ncbi:bifunctional ADP-dependent NAD(P)H-hydrate dehydratase/NAD(P)H-hydrate epimerase [Idiomarina xiamenensis]|nr:bifunctional ADP-dependent NAD(P)H-hydrate dehydratase/NAD(P)H-hydrate epimerase [Idiomarina xiamenensis]
METELDTITTRLPQVIYQAQTIRAGEQAAAKQCGVSMNQLMLAAGHAVFEWLTQVAPTLSGQRNIKRVVVLCGKGNNGGDAYIVARLALQRGYQVTVYATDEVSDGAQAAYQAWRDSGGRQLALTEFNTEVDADVIVDGLLGSGLQGEVREPYASAISACNAHPALTVAIDLPSGLSADSGQPLGCALRADATITFIGLFAGLFTGAGADYCGQIFFAGLGVNDAFDAQQAAWLQRYQPQLPLLPRRAAASHKGSHGHVLIVGGQPGMSGAVTLAMQSALRAGAGKVSVACHPQVQAIVAGGMVQGVATVEALQPMLKQADVVVLGCGLGQTDWAEQLWRAVIDSGKPLVIDADGLQWLARYPRQLQSAILTPHPGEAATLLGRDTAWVQQQRVEAVQQLQRNFGAHCLLKGAGSLVATRRASYLVDRGSAALAVAGMGDLLSGIIAALWVQNRKTAQNLSGAQLDEAQAMDNDELVAQQALLTAVWLHAVAGERAAEQGARGTLPSDLLGIIRQLVN